MIATSEDLLRILTRYEGAVQEVNDSPGDEALEKELSEAREDLLNLLKQCRVVIETK